MKSLRCAALALSALVLACSVNAQIVSNTIFVPLHYTQISSGAYKLGIYASMGGGTPQIFEFDTGGAGLYAAYASSNTSKSAWWGTNYINTDHPVTNTYDSGIQYTGTAVTTSVSLYSNHHSITPLITTADNLRVGQMTNIANTNGDTPLWTPEGEGQPGNPPVDGAFFGDFGMSMNYAPNGIVNLVAQLTFTNGILPGFRVRAHGDNPYLQIGLTTDDTASTAAFYFTMNTNTNAPAGAKFTNSESLFYSEQIFNANMTISNATTNFTANLGITTDTGASTTIHNADLGGLPDALIRTNNDGKLFVVSDANFELSALTLEGISTNFFQFITTDQLNNGQIAIQDNKSNTNLFYLNTGITLFQQYDVIYNLHDGEIGFQPVPEPSTWLLFGLGAIILTMIVRRNYAVRRL